MKKSRIKYLVILIIMWAGCSDWLDVNPRTEMKEDEVYSTEDGFRSVLNGVYVRLGSADLYGKNMSVYIPELLVRHWSILNSTGMDYNLANYQYTNMEVEALFEQVWKKYYECIAYLNDILANAEIHREVFTETGYPILKGEALGLRAFLHFELLRLFGPVPEEGMDLQQPVIPYVEELTKDPNKLLVQQQETVLAKILRDLNAAEEYLNADPVIDSLDNGYTGRKDNWYKFRQSRFNYYAVKAVKARYYQWIGDTDNAVKYAKEIVEAKNAGGTVKFSLATESYLNGKEASRTFRCEHLFGIYNSKFQDIAIPLFGGTAPGLQQNSMKVAAAYESAVNPDDIRNKDQRYWKGNEYQKYLEGGIYKAENTVPLLRLAEMYLILAEELPVDEAFEYFSIYRKARNMSGAMENSFLTEKDLRIEKEYRKEFFAEGQMFFYYKRHKTTAFTWPSTQTINPENYVIPLPQSMQAFQK